MLLKAHPCLTSCGVSDETLVLNYWIQFSDFYIYLAIKHWYNKFPKRSHDHVMLKNDNLQSNVNAGMYLYFIYNEEANDKLSSEIINKLI